MGSMSENGVDSKDETQATEENRVANKENGTKPRFCYTKEEMIAISKLACSRMRPKCLDVAFNSEKGLWNPERWMASKSGDSISSISKLENANTSNFKRERHLDGHDKESVMKRRSCDQKERLKEESQNEIVLSPQRRSFGTGCHVTAKNENRQRDGHTDSRDGEHLPHRSRNGQQSRVGSGRVMNSRDRGSDWNDRTFEKERNFEGRGNYRDEEGGRRSGRYNRYNDHENKRQSNSRARHTNFRESRSFDEDEPEWFTGGPTSQNETIELKGFEESEEEKNGRPSSRNKWTSHQSSRSQSRASSQGDVQEEKERSLRSSACNASEKSTEDKSNSEKLLMDTRRKDSSMGQEFDINEMFKMDNWKMNSLVNESIVPVPVNIENTTNVTSTGTSRFAQWFSENQRESSPIDRLFANATTHVSSQSSSARDDVLQLLGAANFAAKNGIGDNFGISREKEKNEAERDIVNLFHKSININHLMQNSIPNANFDANKAKRLSELEASLIGSPPTKNTSINRDETSLDNLFNQMEKHSSTEADKNGHNQDAFEHRNLIDLLQEDDVFPGNNSNKPYENNLLLNQIHQKFNPDLISSLNQGNTDPKNHYFMKNFTENLNLTRASEMPLKGKHAECLGEKSQLIDLDTSSARNSAPSNIAAFTPTSVIRKIASEKDKETIQKIVGDESKILTTSQNQFSINGNPSNQGLMNTSLPRPIVKGSNIQSSPQQIPNTSISLNSNLYHGSNDFDALTKFIEQQRLQQQQQQSVTAAALAAQRQMNISPLPNPLQANPASLRLATPRTATPPIRPILSNTTNSNQNISIPVIRNMVHAATMNPPVRTNPMNPLQFQLLQRGALDPRQLQAFAQTRSLHPVALQHIIKAAAANIQTQAAAAAAAAAAVSAAHVQAATLGLSGARTQVQQMSPTRPLMMRPELGQVKENVQLVDLQNHQNIQQASNYNAFTVHSEMQGRNRQSPENLTKWFGSEVLNQKLPEMPPVPIQKALLLEEIERE